ncbi:MAG: hypothetical protein AAFY29_05655 [Pseudomonadota bacterium]
MLKHARRFIVPPVSLVQRRNTIADWTFYDVGALTRPEFNWLASQRIEEGSILVVLPTGGADELCIRKHVDHEAMIAAPGDLVRHFAIAGVGSSDVGAAALARTLANHLDEPVGAIVAGYGMADIVQEALGGWFFFGAANRAQALLDRFGKGLSNPLRGGRADEGEGASILARCSKDTRTLLRLLHDEGREIETILGHSKGCLSIAYAFNELRDLQGPDALTPFRDIKIITAGAVVALPDQLQRVHQYLGSIDWFGGLNSIPGTAHTRVPYSWHHLNTDIPLHMNLSQVLLGRYDPVTS